MITCAKFTIHSYFPIETASLCKSLKHFIYGDIVFQRMRRYKKCNHERPYGVYLVIDTFVYVATDT